MTAELEAGQRAGMSASGGEHDVRHGDAAGQPLVSVVVPAFKSEAFLGAAVESILHQTHDNLELIVVDDTPADGCRRIVEAYADARLRYMRGPGSGLPAALNAAIATARGDYIARMDADDVALPERLAEQLRFMREHDVQICGSWLSLIGRAGRVVRFPQADVDVKFALLFMCPLAHPSVIGEARWFRKHPYDPARKTAEDYDLWVRLARQGARFGNVPRALLRYRIHPSQSTSTSSERLARDSQAICAAFAEPLLSPPRFQLLSQLSFGLAPRYPLDQAVALAGLAVEIADDMGASSEPLEILLPAFFKRVHPMRPRVALAYSRFARRAKVSRLSRESLNLLVQSLLRADNDTRLFRLARMFWRH